MQYQSNETQICLPESDVVFNYRIRGNALTLSHPRTGIRVTLKRLAG